MPEEARVNRRKLFSRLDPEYQSMSEWGRLQFRFTRFCVYACLIEASRKSPYVANTKAGHDKIKRIMREAIEHAEGRLALAWIDRYVMVVEKPQGGHEALLAANAPPLPLK